jgi:hypothetical protein
VAPASMVEPIARAAVQLTAGRSVSGVPVSTMALMKGALRIMFWSKLRTTAAVALTGALLCGSGFLGYRAMGRQQVAPSGQEPTKRGVSDAKPASAVPSDVDSQELAALGKARMELAKKLRDLSRQLWESGETSITDYLAAQRRFDEVVAEVMVKTDADRIQLLERTVAGFKRLEDHFQVLHRAGQVRESDVLVVELGRLDAEYDLAKARARAGGHSK